MLASALVSPDEYMLVTSMFMAAEARCWGDMVASSLATVASSSVERSKTTFMLSKVPVTLRPMSK